MCYNWMPIKSRSANGLKHFFIPCGHCVECRNSTRSQWSIRLALEMQNCHRQGWKMAFFTLTYDDEHLPHLPYHCLSGEGIEHHSVISEYGEITGSDIPCFDREHVKNFVLSLRKWLHRNYGITAVKYLIASDIGRDTKRPHYHGLISYPVNLPKLHTRYVDKSAPDLFDSFVLHAKIKELWNYGFVFPRHPLGGRDVHGYDHKPFEISGDIVKASFYAAKYCAKSVVFYDITKDMVDSSRDDWKRYDCFHVQSKSLGLSYIKDMTYEQKKHLLSYGISFVGSDKVYPVPVYYKNKILFDPNYTYRSDGTRIVSREVSDFFLANYEGIFEEKVKFYSQLAQDCCSMTMQQVKGVPDSELSSGSLFEFKHLSGLDFDGLAREFLARYGVKTFGVYKGLSHADQWLQRYFPKHCDYLKVDYRHVIPQKDWPMRFWSCLFSTLGVNTPLDEDWQEEKARVKDFHVSQIEKECLCSVQE